MRASLQEFLASRVPFPGLAGCGARLPDRTFYQQSFVSWLPPSQMEQALVRLAQATESLKRHSLEPFRLCWSFEHLRIHIVTRGDGSWLALFLENRPDLPAAAVEAVLGEYARLSSSETG